MRINRQLATRAVLPSAQTSSEDSEQPMKIEKANLQLQIIMMCIETHMMQVGAWEKLKRLWRILGVMVGVKQPVEYILISTTVDAPLLVLSLDPQKGIRDPHRGPIGRLR